MIAVAIAAAVAWLATCAVALRLGLAWLAAQREERAKASELTEVLRLLDVERAAREAADADLRDKIREVERGLVTSKARVRA